MENEEINWKDPVKNKHYVVFPELPENIREPFKDWLKGKKRPIVFKEGDNFCDCAYYSDYKLFLEMFMAKNKKDL